MFGQLKRNSRIRWLVSLLGLALGLAVAPFSSADPLAAQRTPARANTGDVWRYYLPSLLEPIPDTEAYTSSLIQLGQPPIVVNATPAVPRPSSGASEAPTPRHTQTPDEKGIADAPSISDAKAPEALPVLACGGFVVREGDQLFLDGQPFSFVGTNVSYLLEDYFPEDEAAKVLAYLADAGATGLRIWLFPQHDLERAERLLTLGSQHNLRFVVTLVNYYYDKGGWWFDPTHYSKEYLPHVRQVVARFRDRPEIMMWELMNEPNCSTDTEGGCPGNMVRWAKAVSEEIKAIDPCHLVTTGTLRADPPEGHFRDLHALETIDVVSIHKAADLWLEREIAIAAELNKPVLLGEIYARGYDKSCQPLGAMALEDRAELVAADMSRAWAEGVDGYLLWQYGHGRVQVGEQIQYYCNGYDYLRDDPVWALLGSAPVPRLAVER